MAAAAAAETERCRNETGVAVGVSAAADTGVKCCDAGWSVLRRQVSYGHKSNVRSADNTQRVSRSSHYVVCSLSDCRSSSSSSSTMQFCLHSTPAQCTLHLLSTIHRLLSFSPVPMPSTSQSARFTAHTTFL